MTCSMPICQVSSFGTTCAFFLFSDSVNCIASDCKNFMEMFQEVAESQKKQEENEGAVVRPVDWTVVRGSNGRFAAGPSSSGASESAGHNLVDNEPPRGSRRSQSAGTDWLVTSPQPGGPQICV